MKRVHRTGNKKEGLEMELGKTLKELRIEKKMCQKDVAAYLGVSNGTMSNYENDVHVPVPAALCKLADLYGVSVDYLFGRTTER